MNHLGHISSEGQNEDLKSVLTSTDVPLADQSFLLDKLLFLNISLAIITRQATWKSYPHLVTSYRKLERLTTWTG